MDNSTGTRDSQALPQAPEPDPALKRLDRLVGTWNITGRTPGSDEDDISGRTLIEWLPGGYFLQLRGAMEFRGSKVESLEIIGYDPETRAFSSYVYSNLGGVPARYGWDVQGDTLTHWDEDSRYIGTFSEDGGTITGGWRPNEGKEGPDNIAYDAIMTRIRSEQ